MYVLVSYTKAKSGQTNKARKNVSYLKGQSKQRGNERKEEKIKSLRVTTNKKKEKRTISET